MRKFSTESSIVVESSLRRRRRDSSNTSNTRRPSLRSSLVMVDNKPAGSVTLCYIDFPEFISLVEISNVYCVAHVPC